MERVEMNKPAGILIFGANGSGKTTLGRKLARLLDFQHIDHEDYCFEKTVVPYAKERPREEYTALMLNDIKKHRYFIISACKGNFGEEIESFYRLAVYLEAPLELRIERVKKRNTEKFGKRAEKGGALYEQMSGFINFVSERPLSLIEEYGKTLKCPVISLDGTSDIYQNAVIIAEEWRALECSH